MDVELRKVIAGGEMYWLDFKSSLTIGYSIAATVNYLMTWCLAMVSQHIDESPMNDSR